MIFLTNAFSLQMLNGDNTVDIKELTKEQTIKILNKNDFISAIGHTDTASIVSDLLERPIEANRVSITMDKEDFIIVAQLTGGRLPEGATTLPDGFNIKFLGVSILNMNHFISM